MKKAVWFPIITLLLSVCVLLTLSLSLKDLAQKKYDETRSQIMHTLLPDSENFVFEEYIGTDSNIVSIHKGETGYVVETLVYGYADYIRTMVAVDTKGTVVGIMVINMYDTFGLGLNALTDHEFLSQYLGSSTTMEVGDTIDAIAGATVTSKAITKSVNSAIAFVTGADIDSGATEWGE